MVPKIRTHSSFALLCILSMNIQSLQTLVGLERRTRMQKRSGTVLFSVRSLFRKEEENALDFNLPL